jgi:hypothetical protein
MQVIYLPNKLKTTQGTIPLGTIPRYYTIREFEGSVHPVPYGYVPVRCQYTGNLTGRGHRWKNPYHKESYKRHPLGVVNTPNDNSFYEDFIELTNMKDLLYPTGREKWFFHEGESWCIQTNKRVQVEKTDPRLVWNPFFQRYDEPCDNNKWNCASSPRVCYGSSVSDVRILGNSLHELLENDMTTFLQVYCTCCICERCRKIHDYSCDMDAATSSRVGAVLQSTETTIMVMETEMETTKSTNMEELD